MGAYAWSPWTILNGGLPTGGLPILWGQGPLIPGKSMGVALTPQAGVGVWLIVSTTELGLPFKGGTLWPSPDAIFGPRFLLFTDAIASGFWPAGLPAGFTFVAQAWWPDPAASQGWTGSTGLQGVQP